MSSRIYTTRRLKSASGADIKGTTGKYIRVRIHKENRTVLKVKEDNWTNEAYARYAELFPNDIDVKKCRKKVDKSKIKKKAPPVEEEKDDCPICQCELPKATTTLECGHSYCTGCILTWFKRKNNCPMCRAEVKEAPSANAVGRVHIDYHHACDILDLTNRILNGQSMSLTSAFTNTQVGFGDIHREYRTPMLRRSSRQMGRGATRPNGHRFVEAFVEVVNRLSANIGDDEYNRYFTSNGNH